MASKMREQIEEDIAIYERAGGRREKPLSNDSAWVRALEGIEVKYNYVWIEKGGERHRVISFEPGPVFAAKEGTTWERLGLTEEEIAKRREVALANTVAATGEDGGKGRVAFTPDRPENDPRLNRLGKVQIHRLFGQHGSIR